MLVAAATPAVAGPLSISGPARVTDGGTIIINGNSIRLQGLDAEELAMTNGPKAAAVMRNITADHMSLQPAQTGTTSPAQPRLSGGTLPPLMAAPSEVWVLAAAR